MNYSITDRRWANRVNKFPDAISIDPLHLESRPSDATTFDSFPGSARLHVNRGMGCKMRQALRRWLPDTQRQFVDSFVRRKRRKVPRSIRAEREPMCPRLGRRWLQYTCVFVSCAHFARALTGLLSIRSDVFERLQSWHLSGAGFVRKLSAPLRFPLRQRKVMQK